MLHPELYAALIHYPVVNKNGDEIASAVTNLDLHDIARAARTFGLKGFYVITPLADQQELSKRVVGHWTEGYGKTYNPDRFLALQTIDVLGSLDDMVQDIVARTGKRPKLIATGAGGGHETISFLQLRRSISDGGPHVLMFGTAWGLAESVMARADEVLAPIRGVGDYNHLSVRCAAAIMFDRLMVCSGYEDGSGVDR